ncbi:hypothetical protein M8C21_020616, partial [Ambrosia artemisiifolia]
MTKYLIDEKYTSYVSNQKHEGICLALTFADMISMVLKITREERIDLILSPQPLIDASVFSVDKFRLFCSEVGLESVNTFPFTRIKRGAWKEKHYIERNLPRYYIGGITYHKDKVNIRKAILDNFALDGKKFPILCAIDVEHVLENEEAKRRAINKIPFHPPVEEVREPRLKKAKIKQDDHAMLIIGCDTTNSDPKMHYCMIKNSYGKGWGLNGVSVVPLDYFNYIMVPNYEYTIQEEPKTPLDKELDANVLKECIFVDELPLFAEVGDIKTYFKKLNLKLKRVDEDPVKEVCFVTRDDLTYTKSAIVKMPSKEDVIRFIELNSNRNSNVNMMGEVKLRFQKKEDWERAQSRHKEISTIISLSIKDGERVERKTEVKDNL